MTTTHGYGLYILQLIRWLWQYALF